MDEDDPFEGWDDVPDVPDVPVAQEWDPSLEKPRDVLLEVLTERVGETTVDPPVTCRRCGKIFEGPIRDAKGRVIIPGHVQGDPVTCIRAGKPIWDARERRLHR